MAGLKIKLRPEEEILINGAVIKNGKNQIEMTILTPDTNILRLKDAIHFEDATTPVKYLCYLAQLVVSGEVEPEEVEADFTAGTKSLKNVFLSKEHHLSLDGILENATHHNYYKAMQGVRKFIPLEAALLSQTEQAIHHLNLEMSNVNLLKSLQQELSKQSDQFDVPDFLRKKKA